MALRYDPANTTVETLKREAIPHSTPSSHISPKPRQLQSLVKGVLAPIDGLCWFSAVYER